MKLGISGQALGEVMAFEAIVDVAANYGISHFELWPCNVPGTGFGYRNRDIGVICDMIRRRGITIDCVTLEAAFCETAVESADAYADMLMGAIDAAVAVGAGLVNHYCYYINMDEKPNFVRMEAFWNKPLQYAKEKHVKLVLENEAHDGTRRPELMAAIMEHFHDDAFRTNYDAVNYFHASAEGFPGAYEILKPYIEYVHLKNACLHREGSGPPEENMGAPMSGVYAGNVIQYAPIPDGSVNMAGLLTTLVESGYDGVCTLEPHTTPECVELFYERDTQWLRKQGFFNEPI